MKAFGQRLRILRSANKETQEDFAKRLGLSKQIISNYENDARSPDIETLAAIADKLDVSTDFLLGRVELFRHDKAIKGSYTGLSDRAVYKLHSFSHSAPKLVVAVDFLIRECEGFLKDFKRLIFLESDISDALCLIRDAKDNTGDDKTREWLDEISKAVIGINDRNHTISKLTEHLQEIQEWVEDDPDIIDYPDSAEEE